MLVVGSCAIAYGAWVLSEPAGFVVGGVLLLAGGLARSRAVAAKVAQRTEKP